MMKLLPIVLLIAPHGLAQAQSAPKNAATRIDNCAPVGKTAKGELVYSMKCDNVPAPVSARPQAEVSETPAPEPEVQRGGIFGWRNQGQ